jgi:hypothetical protein
MLMIKKENMGIDVKGNVGMQQNPQHTCGP